MIEIDLSAVLLALDGAVAHHQEDAERAVERRRPARRDRSGSRPRRGCRTGRCRAACRPGARSRRWKVRPLARSMNSPSLQDRGDRVAVDIGEQSRQIAQATAARNRGVIDAMKMGTSDAASSTGLSSHHCLAAGGVDHHQFGIVVEPVERADDGDQQSDRGDDDDQRREEAASVISKKVSSVWPWPRTGRTRAAPG